MSYKTMTVQRQGYVMVISINRPADVEKMVELSNELAGLCKEITWDEEVRVVIIAGVNENSFSMKMDFINRVSWANQEGGTKFLTLSESIAQLDRPVIAAINGDAIGQGLELALACDIRIASDTSYFGFPQIKAGLIPWDGGTQRLLRLVGRGKASEMILTGEVINAQEALRMGLVNKIVPPDKLMTASMDMGKEMGARGPIASRYAKEAIYKGMDMTLEQGLHLEADLYLLIHTTNDRSEGIKAFQEKRSPHFKGK